MTALSYAVLHVIFLNSKEQVLGPDAGWIVAVMENPQAVRYFTKGQDPGDPVGPVRGAPESSPPITVIIPVPDPLNAARLHFLGFCKEEIQRPRLTPWHDSEDIALAA